ncbi:MAG: DVU0298 family protein [Thermodesulfobacteriota bacterium]
MRELKRQVLGLLAALDSGERLQPILALDPHAATGPLFAALLHPDLLTRWRAVTALGATTAALADRDLEDARTVMRRFMWHMNEESGNIGWGIPEAMGETMARHPGLAREYGRILCSYVRDFEGVADSTWIDHPPLRAGAWWGIARLAETRPEIARAAVPDLLAGLATGPHTPDSLARETDLGKAHILLALAALRPPEAGGTLAALAGSTTPVTIYRDYQLHPTTLGELARLGVTP